MLRIATLLTGFVVLFSTLCSPAIAAPQEPSDVAAPAVEAEKAKESGGENEEPEATGVDAFFKRVNGVMEEVIFYKVPVPFTSMPDPDAPGSDKTGEFPLAVLILVLGSVFFTIRMGLPQLGAFKHAIDVVRGKYDDPSDEGEVTSFQALTAALSATVGLGNIAGVAIAVVTGGPGATFWMILAGFLGMASKFTECTLGQMYRERRPDGRLMGGAMHYLSKGLSEIGLGRLGKVLAAFFAVVCIGASLGGGNTFQVNMSMGAVGETIPFVKENPWVYGLFMSLLVGVVIIGGIKRIAQTAEKIVPTMCGIYLLACIVIIAMNLGAVPAAIGEIFSGAFNPDAMLGGFIGVLVIGFQRAAFSNEAGIGSAAIAHSAARVPHPSREGIVALLEPFIDTIVVCTMTALVIIITGAYNNPDYAAEIAGKNGAALTSKAMGSELAFMPYVLAIAVMLFAYSTMISWSYYGERCWAYLFGDGSSMIYRIIFVVFVFLGSMATAQNILNFGDLLIFGMVLPNIIGVLLLSGKVRRRYDEYMTKLRAGEYKTFK
ncbi:MAG: alanine/glycine:cation symporter family protein [Planctomycetota bacterium]|nr:alanine/glycine:cation symporter family protein [Planctomycetota bacterium]